jgi:RNA polymerase sigma-70 factor (ECF subfamily)
LVGDGTLADDIIQETFLRAQITRSGFEGRANLGTWLAAIALNIARDHFRRQATRVEIAASNEVMNTMPTGDDAERALLEREMAACITSYLMTLPERQRQILALHDMGGASHAEVAEVLGMTEGNARVLLHRSRAALRAKLRQHCRWSFGSDAIPCTPLENRIQPKCRQPASAGNLLNLVITG